MTGNRPCADLSGRGVMPTIDWYRRSLRLPRADRGATRTPDAGSSCYATYARSTTRIHIDRYAMVRAHQSAGCMETATPDRDARRERSSSAPQQRHDNFKDDQQHNRPLERRTTFSIGIVVQHCIRFAEERQFVIDAVAPDAHP